MPGFANNSRRLLSVPNAGPSSSELTIVNRTEWMIYGANGYTGRLVAAEAKRRGQNPLLAGRRAGPIEKLATELGLRARVFDLQSVRICASLEVRRLSSSCRKKSEDASTQYEL